MNGVRALRAELLKLASLPSCWVGLALAGVGCPALALLVRGQPMRDPANDGFNELAFGAVGVIVLGVIAVGSEYGGDTGVMSPDASGSRQVQTSLGAVPVRGLLFGAKSLATAVVALLASVVAVPLTLWVARGTPLGGDRGRVAGLAAYWVCTALLAFAVTALARNVIVPMVVLLANTSLISVSYLATRVSTLGFYLPDMAGMHLFIRNDRFVAMAPLTGGLVMAAWTVTLLVVAGATFRRRDA